MPVSVAPIRRWAVAQLPRGAILLAPSLFRRRKLLPDAELCFRTIRLSNSTNFRCHALEVGRKSFEGYRLQERRLQALALSEEPKLILQSSVKLTQFP